MTVVETVRQWLGRFWARCIYTTRAILFPGQVLTLERSDEVLHVTSGQVWVSAGKEDLLIKQGQAYRLPAGVSRAVVTGLGKRGVAYEIECDVPAGDTQ